MRSRTTRLKSLLVGIEVSGSLGQATTHAPQQRRAAPKVPPMPIRESAPLCLTKGLRWGKAEEVWRGPSPGITWTILSRSARVGLNGWESSIANRDDRITTRLLLVRHGRSSHVHDGRWLRHHDVGAFEDAYDAAGIRDDSMPSEELRAAARNADLVVASDLPRAVASAKRLAGARGLVTSPLLREIRLEPPRWVPVALPINAWDVFSHWQWSYRLRV